MKMEHYHYFNTIIENDFNITLAASLLHISQPALTHMILKIENSEDIKIFIRQKNRLVGLTPIGEIFYNYSKKIWDMHQELIDEITEEVDRLCVSMNLGLPPIIISDLFDDLLPKLINENPKIDFITFEYGAERLKEMFLDDEVSIVALLRPTGFDLKKVEEVFISHDVLSAYVGENNPLASKKLIDWKDLERKPLAVLNDSFMVHHLLKTRLKSVGVKANIQYQSSSIELLINSTRTSDLITILPSPVGRLYNIDGIKKLDFKTPIDWDVVICRKRQKRFSIIEDYVFNYMNDHFRQRIK